MNNNILQRLNRLEAEKGKIHQTTFYCENLNGRKKIFATQEEAVAYEKQNPGWYAETKFTFPNGNVLIWNNATLYRIKKGQGA